MSAKNIYPKLGYLLWTMSLMFVLLPNWPHIYYRLSPNTSKQLASTIASTAIAVDVTITESSDYDPDITLTNPLPPFDSELSLTTTLVIPKIKLNAPVVAGDDWEDILTRSIWQVPNFGTPEDNSKPIILAAHRWGYLNWTQTFRQTKSFYNLPRLNIGDQIYLTYNQRQYEYIVYSTISATAIPEYTADLILYTCELWNSPQRFFVFAKRVPNSI